MKKWRIGIVGAGLIADFHARSIGEIANATLVGVYDKHGERAKALSSKYDVRSFDTLEELLGEVDVITIGTPSGVHLEAAVAGAKAGVGVLCEKPLEITPARIDEMTRGHEEAGTMLGGIFQNRFNPAMEPLRRAVSEGRFGNISYVGVYVPWWREDSYYDGSWHGSLDLDGGGALMNQSIHMVDMLVDLMGLPESVQAYTGAIAHDIEAEDTAVGIMRFASGTLGIVYGTTASWPGQFKRFEITGSTGTVVYLEDAFTVWQFGEEWAEDDVIREKFGAGETSGGGASDPGAISNAGHVANISAYLKAMEEGGGFEIDGKEARKSVELICAIYEAARTGKCVRLGE